MHSATFYTIGHSTRQAEDFLSLLKNYGIRYLVDVRSVPRSRFNPQYNQKTLKDFLESNGITYVFMGKELGGRPEDLDCYTPDGHISYERVKQKDFFKKGIERLKQAYHKNVSLALMCSEGKPQECHRSKLIGVALSEEKFILSHIDEKGELKSQEEVMRLIQVERSGNLF